MEYIRLFLKKAEYLISVSVAYMDKTFLHIWSHKKSRSIFMVGVISVVCAVLWYSFFIQPPKDFPKHSLFDIPEGSTLNQVSQKLHNQGYILSPFWFKVTVSLTSGSSSVQAGDYFFAKEKNLIAIAKRVTSGDYGLEPERVTIHEGLSSFKVAELFASRFPKFDPEYFVNNAPEGYLFPDTYFFLPTIKATDVIQTMRQNFDRQIISVKEDLEKFGKPLEDIIKMASILEGEARKFETRQTVAGILWRRIDLGMPLQVDASFVYINGKNSFTLTTEDLREDSPYNSYTRLGLPPTPISNPGLESIQAAIAPIETKYLYFLTDKTGVMRYGITYDDHLKNRRLYLGK